jgi:pimeloyl-ACP methyl ester carboxylesterase
MTTANNSHSPIVLIHGAWLGGWVWKDVVPRLRAAGYPVFAPTLTGLGERAHLASPAVDLETHIQDIVNALFYEDLRDARLVGHSYAGMLISGVAERAPERLARLIYLDAFVPANGEAMHDLVSAEEVRRNRDLARTIGDGWRMPPLGEISTGALELDRWSNARRTPQSLATYEQAITLTNRALAIPKTYILCADKPVPDLFARYAQHAADDPAWQFRTFLGDHMAMLTAPAELVALLLEVT